MMGRVYLVTLYPTESNRLLLGVAAPPGETAAEAQADSSLSPHLAWRQKRRASLLWPRPLVQRPGGEVTAHNIISG